MKMRRRTGVNGVRENHRDTVVNQGVPPSLSVPYREGRLGFFTKKYRAGYFPEETKTEKKEEENIMAKEKKTGRIHYGQRSRFCTVVHRCGARKQNCVIIQE